MTKTVRVADLIDDVNSAIATSPADAKESRETLAYFLANVLHKTGNYAGFMYNQPYGSPGSDPTRIHYFKHRKLGV